MRVGEARCPGPRPRQASGRNPEAKLLVLNCRRAWRLYEKNMLGAQVVCLQEVSMSSEQWHSFARAFAKKGYSAYHTPGPTSVSRYGHPKYNGGVACLVHRSVKHSPAGCVQLDGCQAAGVWLQDLHVANIYSPPGHDRVAVEIMGQYFIQEGLEHKCWAVVGDFNEEQDSSFVYSFLQAHGGQAVGSATHIGPLTGPFSVASTPRLKFEGVETGQHISDHQGFWLLLPSRMAEPRRGRLKPCPTWKQPENLSTSDWRTLLSKAWQKQVIGSGSLLSLGALLELNSFEDARAHVQQECDLFMLCLNQGFQDALSMASKSPEQSVSDSARMLLKQAGRTVKGRPAVFQRVSDCTRAAGDPSEGESIRKLRRKLAGVYEVKRPVAAGKEVDPRLLAKLC